MSNATSKKDPDLSQAVAETLNGIEAHIDRIAGLMMGEIIAEIDVYAEHNSQLLREQVLANAHDSLVSFISLAREDRVAEVDDFEFVNERVTGPVRAGIGVEAVLRAYRIGHRITWNAITDEAGRLSRGHEVSLVLARRAMEFIDTISEAITLAFARYNRTSEEQGTDETPEMIEAIISGGHPKPTSKTGAKKLDSIASERGYLCLRATLQRDATKRSIADLTESLSRRTVVRQGLISIRRGEVAGILPLQSATSREVGEVLVRRVLKLGTDTGLSVRMGLSLECFGLAEGPNGFKEAGEAMRLATDDRPIVALPLNSTVEQLLGHNDTTLRRHARSRLADLGRLSDSGVRELRRTTLVYAESGLNARAAARELSCHPNTIQYRLSRIRELSGLDPTRFSDLVDLVLALRIRGE